VKAGAVSNLVLTSCPGGGEVFVRLK